MLKNIPGSISNNNLPELTEFDPQAVKQILNNFLSNALKFTSQKAQF